VVIKMLAPGSDPDLQGRFLTEFRTLASLQHSNILVGHELNEDHGVPYMVLELLRGTDLGRAIQAGIKIKVGLSIIVQLLAGLAHVHQKGFAHRDIRPANIFICDDGAVKIVDLGTATTANMAQKAGEIVGAPDYMSPEQVRGSKLDGRSDLFSVGCTLFEMLAGRRPFHSDSLMTIFYKITHEEPNFDFILASPEHDALPALLPILKKSLAKKLEDRYQDAHAMSGDLELVLATLGARAN
jgi:eukaryotic-like serine/threonine-protein kinase